MLGSVDGTTITIEFPGLFTTSAQEAMNAKPYLKVSVAEEESSRR